MSRFSTDKTSLLKSFCRHIYHTRLDDHFQIFQKMVLSLVAVHVARNIAHTVAIRLRSGKHTGQTITSTSMSANNCLVKIKGWSAASSCWKKAPLGDNGCCTELNVLLIEWCNVTRASHQFQPAVIKKRPRAITFLPLTSVAAKIPLRLKFSQ